MDGQEGVGGGIKKKRPDTVLIIYVLCFWSFIHLYLSGYTKAVTAVLAFCFSKENINSICYYLSPGPVTPATHRGV